LERNININYPENIAKYERRIENLKLDITVIDKHKLISSSKSYTKDREK